MTRPGQTPQPDLRLVRAAVMAGMDDHGRSVDPLARVCEVCVGLVPVDGASIAVASDATIGEILYASDYVIR
ncbi:MAG: hypothetical protein ACRDT8_25680, partial [Micromonosporaceae bacterium]